MLRSITACVQPAIRSLHVEPLEERAMLSNSPSSFESASGIAALFGTYEVVLSGNGSVANPFDTRGTVTFTSPSNQLVTVNDFFDGVNTWRARAYVTETGLWHWSASSLTDAGLNGLSGTFAASDTGLPGLLKINPNNSKAWVNERSQQFVYIGDAAWVLFNQNSAFSPDYQGFVNDAAAQGINTLGPAGLLGAWGGISPTITGAGNNDPWDSGGKSRYDLSKFQTTDTRLEWIFDNHPGMYIQGQWIGTEWQYNDAWMNLPQSVRNNTLDYMIARWGAFPNMIWLVSEDQYTYQTSTQTFNRDVGPYIVAHEPWRHLLSTQSIDENFAFTSPSDLNWVDYIPLQVGSDPVALGADQVQRYASMPRHVQLSEDWYEQDDFWHAELSYTADMNFFVRWDFWSWTLAGGSANYGGRWTRADPYSQTGTLSYVQPISGTNFTGEALHGLDSIPYLWPYFQSRNIDLSLFQQNNGLVTAWSTASGLSWHPNLAQRGTSEFLIYDPNAGQQGTSAHLDSARTASMTINLTSTPGTYLVEWYRPSDGAVQSGGTVNGGAPRTFTAPWQGCDVVLRLLEVTGSAAVVGRFLFYNQSGTSTRYDHNDPAINSFDDAAIATDKTAYFWEDTGGATFANVSSYTKGINGIMVDIAGSHSNITADDFIFRVGNNNSPGLWVTANAPTSISVRAGAGVGGSDRVTIIWNGAVAPIKQWLNVIVLANADTGLAQKVGHPVGHGDAFFFGNAVGNTGLGDTSANALVSAADGNAIRSHIALPSANIPITNIYDVGRNGSVSAVDEGTIRLNGTNPTTALKYLNLATTAGAPEADGGDDDGGVASALTAPSLAGLPPGVPKWLSNRAGTVDLNSGTPARLSQYLHDTTTTRSRALLQRFDAAVDALGLDDELLDSLLVDLIAIRFTSPSA